MDSQFHARLKWNTFFNFHNPSAFFPTAFWSKQKKIRKLLYWWNPSSTIKHEPLTIHENCGQYMRRECRERFSRHQLTRRPLVSSPGMHHGTCVTRAERSRLSQRIRNPQFYVSGKRPLTQSDPSVIALYGRQLFVIPRAFRSIIGYTLHPIIHQSITHQMARLTRMDIYNVINIELAKVTVGHIIVLEIQIIHLYF